MVVSLSSARVSCSWFIWCGDIWSPSFLSVVADVFLNLANWDGLIPESEFFLSFSSKNADRELTFLFSPRFICRMFGFKRACLEGGEGFVPTPLFLSLFFIFGDPPPSITTFGCGRRLVVGVAVVMIVPTPWTLFSVL